MIDAKFKHEDQGQKLLKALDRSAFKNVSHAAATIRKEASGSIVRSSEPSAPGSPPHTKRGQFKRAIRFDVDKARQEAVIGPLYSMVGLAFRAHELGEAFHGDKFPERPTMGRALTNNLDRIAGGFAGSLTS